MRKHFYFNDNFTTNIELYRAKDEFSISLKFQNDFENTITFNLTLPFLFKFYISLDTKLCKTKWWQKLLCLSEENKYEGRHFGVKLFPDEVAWGKDYIFIMEFATYPHSSGGGLSVFKSSSELIYGSFEYEKKVLDEENHNVFIPGTYGYSDGYYDLVLRRIVSYWKWKRFNKKYSSTYYDVECENGVPHRFKWGCQDAIILIGVDGVNSREAIINFIDKIQEDRKRYHAT